MAVGAPIGRGVRLVSLSYDMSPTAWSEQSIPSATVYTEPSQSSTVWTEVSD